MKIGFIGVGLMGHGMAVNLLKHDHEVFVIAHRKRQAVEDLVERGAIEMKDLDEVARHGDIIFLCLPSSLHVEDAIAKLKPGLSSGKIIIDAGTSQPASTRKLAEELESLGVRLVDAPLTGGPEQSTAAALGALCGGSLDDFERVKPLVSCFASTVRHVGPVGHGHAAKLVSNFLVTGMIALVAEAFRSADKLQLDWNDLYAVMLNGSGNSGVLRKMIGPALEGNFDGYRFSVGNAAKDIGYFQELETGSQLSNTIQEFFLRALAQGKQNDNVSQLLES